MSTPGAGSVAQKFLHRVRATPDRLAYRYPAAAGAGGWAEATWRQTHARVEAQALGLRALGLDHEQRAGIFAQTRFEWILADLAILCAGGATTTVYPSSTPDEAAFVLSDSDTRIVFAEDDAQVAKLAARRDALPHLAKVVTIDGRAGHDGWVITLADLEALGRARAAAAPGELAAVAAAVRPDHLATLIYTSGTTGRPKGVELTHDNWVYTGEAIASVGILSVDDHQYLWLPLSHSFGKVLEAVQLELGFSTTVDGRIPKLVENLAVDRPTFMAAAPRIFEKVYNKVVTGVQEAGGVKLALFRWAVGVGRRVSQRRQAGQEPGALLALQAAVADRLVFGKLRARFGGRLRFFISGSAPLSRDIAEFFHACGILILEGYGLTETSAASFVNLPGRNRFGTVGPPVPGTEVRIAPEDGEVLIRGRGVMRGYHDLPAETAETLKDGWLHTGDIGEVDDGGFLRITDRKKDLIKTSGGKYVAPQALEAKLKVLCPYLGHVVVHGDRRNFCSALVTLDPEGIESWAADAGLGGLDLAALSKHPKVTALVQAAVDQLNAGLASYETVKRVAVLPVDFTVETGELTPSLKLKRKVVEKKFAAVLDAFYKDALASA
jgi:long-chain acyl-CoA synthetase